MTFALFYKSLHIEANFLDVHNQLLQLHLISIVSSCYTTAAASDTSDGLLKPPAQEGRPRTASGRKVPAGAVSMFGGVGGGNPLAAALSKRRQSSADVS